MRYEHERHSVGPLPASDMRARICCRGAGLPNTACLPGRERGADRREQSSQEPPLAAPPNPPMDPPPNTPPPPHTPAAVATTAALPKAPLKNQQRPLCKFQRSSWKREDCPLHPSESHSQPQSRRRSPSCTCVSVRHKRSVSGLSHQLLLWPVCFEAQLI